MNASWRNDQSQRTPLDSSQRPQLSRIRASTAPGSLYPDRHPRVLMPGHRPQSIHTSDIFFTSAYRPPPVPPHPRHAPIHTQSFPPPLPPLPPPPIPSNLVVQQTMTPTPPPIPPKPPSHSGGPHSTFSASFVSPSTINSAQTNYTTINTTFNRTNSTNVPSSPQSSASSPDRNEDGLALAMELSQSEARNEQKVRDKISTQEEEDLARALKESLLSGPSFSAGIGTSFASSSGNALNSFLILGDEVSEMVEPANNGQVAGDEALALRLALEEASAVDTPKTPVTSSPPAARVTIVPDRTLPGRPTSTPSSPNIISPTATSKLPAYSDVVRSPAAPGPSPTSPPTAESRIVGRSPSPSASPHLPQNVDSSSSYTGAGSSMPSHSLNHMASRISLVDSEGSVTEANPPPNPTVVNVNHFVDKKLFKGVSIGFFAPPISTDLITTLEVMPNIISLPHGKCPPLHLQGPSWRHLLKLMAMLSGTRLEATVEAMAISKTEMQLRTVVQFVKPLRSSSEWRTILYFTLDHPSPRPGDANARQNVNALPYSYSLSTIPTLLRDAADTPISKTYTIISSDAVPFPTLPITFPSLAMYLQAALEDSRRYLNDSSSGNRKLAKMVQTCYPSRAESALSEEPGRSSVGGLFMRVMGRTNRSRTAGGNEDTYELVTPFVPDEWG